MNRYAINMHDTNGYHNIIPSIIVIDSADRDTITDSQNSYTITLKKPLRDVRSVRLVQCIIPNSNYNIMSGLIHVTVADLGTDPAPSIVGTTGGTALSIDDGLYEEADIITALETLIDAEFAGANATVTIDPVSSKVLITCDKAFSLYFDGGLVDGRRVYRTNSIGALLGFRPANYASTESIPFEIEGTYPCNLELDRYIILKIKGMNRYDSVNKYVQDAFCIIPLDIRTDRFNMLQNLNNLENEAMIYQCSKGMKLHKFVIEFLDWNGNLYNFRGLDHFMTFEVISESHRQNCLPWGHS